MHISNFLEKFPQHFMKNLKTIWGNIADFLSKLSQICTFSIKFFKSFWTPLASAPTHWAPLQALRWWASLPSRKIPAGANSYSEFNILNWFGILALYLLAWNPLRMRMRLEYEPALRVWKIRFIIHYMWRFFFLRKKSNIIKKKYLQH